MSTEENYERVYTGSDVNVQYLQERFNKAGISSRVRNDFDSGLRAGFGGGLPGQVQIFVESTHLEEASKIVTASFKENYNDEEE